MKKKILAGFILIYLGLVAFGNYYVNGPMERKINKRRTYLTTERAISFFPSLFYVKNLKYNLYSKKFTIRHTVKKSVIFINPISLLYKKVSILSASGWNVDFIIAPPEPPLPETGVKRKWRFDLANITLRHIYGKIKEYEFLAPKDTIDLSIYIPPEGKGELEFNDIRWRARGSSVPGVISLITGIGGLEFTGELKEFINKAKLDLDYEIKIKNSKVIPKIGAITNLLLSKADISLNLKLNKGEISKKSFARIKNFDSKFNYKKWIFAAEGEGEWKNLSKKFHLHLNKFKMMDLTERPLVTSSHAEVNLTTKEEGIKNWANKQDIEVLIPDVKVPYLSYWVNDFSGDLKTLKGSARGKLTLSAKAGTNKNLTTKFNGLVDVKEIKVKKTYFSGKFNVTSELTPQNKNAKISTGNVTIDSVILGKFKKPLYPEKPQAVKVEIKDLVVDTESKVTEGKVFTELADTRQALNFIYENFKFPRLIAFLFVQENPTFEADLKITPSRIEITDTKAVIKKHHRILRGDWFLDKKSDGSIEVNGEGSFKFNIFNIKFAIKKNKLKLF